MTHTHTHTHPATGGTSQCNSVPVPSPDKWEGLRHGRASGVKISANSICGACQRRLIRCGDHKMGIAERRWWFMTILFSFFWMKKIYKEMQPDNPLPLILKNHNLKLSALSIVFTHLISTNKWSLACVYSHVSFQSAGFVKLFTTASPLASQFFLFVVAAHVRC